MRHHGPELNAQNAIRAPDNFLGHRELLNQTAKAKDQRSVKKLVTAALAARWE
jgi:hypothetical protein